MVPVIGIEGSREEQRALEQDMRSHGVVADNFVSTQPAKLVQLIATELGISDYSTILNWELELFDTQPAVTGGMSKEFIFAPRIDDKLCSWAAIEGLVEAIDLVKKSGSISLVALFDDEEIGSKLRQGAAGNFLPAAVERIVEAFAENGQGRSVQFPPEKVPQSIADILTRVEFTRTNVCKQLYDLCRCFPRCKPQRKFQAKEFVYCSSLMSISLFPPTSQTICQNSTLVSPLQPIVMVTWLLTLFQQPFFLRLQRDAALNSKSSRFVMILDQEVQSGPCSAQQWGLEQSMLVCHS